MSACYTVKWNSNICERMFMQTGDRTQGTIFTCADKWWNPVIQHSFVMQLVQMTSNLCRWGVKHSTVMQLVQMGGNTVQYSFVILAQMRSNLYKWGVEHSTILICKNLCRWGQTCTNEGWNTVRLCNLCRWGVEHSTIFITHACMCSKCEAMPLCLCVCWLQIFEKCFRSA